MTTGRDPSIWAPKPGHDVTVATRGPDGVEDAFLCNVSRDVYALTQAQKRHAEKHHVEQDDVQVRFA